MKSDDILKNNLIFKKNIGLNNSILSSSNHSIDESFLKSDCKENITIPKFKADRSESKSSTNDQDKEILNLSDMKISPEIFLQSNNLNEGFRVSEERIDKTNLKIDLNFDKDKKDNIEN